jgi:hypothetical protein
MKTKIIILLAASLFLTVNADANFITANPSNYTSFLGSLVPGDTLYLTAGNYTSQLNLTNRNGNAVSPIVIMGAGNTTIFLGNACCNTVNITNCSYLVIKNFKINGQNINYIDGVKAGGGGNYFAHHITIENLLIINNGGNITGDNQTVAISTKCAAWNWTIRRCIIIAAGTGMYLGNSDGTCPFVNGLIENNLVINTKGYNLQIKAQLDTVRDNFAGTSNDFQKTIIRYNVWSKDSGATPIGIGDGSRPCMLMDNFPSTGFGTNDMYEVYGNFFYNNPTEALMQVTGNTTAYDNLFVNRVAPASFKAVVITNHNGFAPRKMNLFHNTVLCSSAAGGIGLTGANASYPQYCYANAVFSAGTPISGFAAANSVDNIADIYTNADTYMDSPFNPFPLLDLYPLVGELMGASTSDTAFTSYTDYNLDFNGNAYNWIYRGAYSGSGINPGWHLQLDTMPAPHGTTVNINEEHGANDFLGVVYPNPAPNIFQFDLQTGRNVFVNVTLSNLEGKTIKTLFTGELIPGINKITADVNGLSSGFYLLNVQLQDRTMTKKVLIQK